MVSKMGHVCTFYHLYGMYDDDGEMISKTPLMPVKT